MWITKNNNQRKKACIT